MVYMSGQMENINGIPIYMSNDIVATSKEFYISYNTRDTSIYGGNTTALVREIPRIKFLILNGNHIKEYNDIINNGGNYKDCEKYFKNNLDKKNKMSENYNEEVIYKDGQFKIVKI